MKTLIAPKPPRFYTPRGEPAYDATLREARKEGLYPSVTTILSVMAKPALESWKSTQYVLAALTRGAKPGEDVDRVAGEVIADGEREAGLAALWGATFHGLIEDFASGRAVAPNPDMAMHWEMFLSWWAKSVAEVIASEAVVAHPSGYAGRIDMVARMHSGGVAIIDFKGRKVRGKVEWYDDQVMQLAAYAQAYEHMHPGTMTGCMSVVIDRDNPSLPHAKAWTMQERERGLRMFRCCLDLWRDANSYYP
jgi:hypothetical protein